MGIVCMMIIRYTPSIKSMEVERMFNQRHYEAIAKVIKPHNEDILTKTYGHHMQLLIIDLVEMLERDNPNFDRVRFIDACGLGIDAPEIIKVS